MRYTSPSPLKTVFFKASAARSATAMPSMYIVHIVNAWYFSAKNAGIIREYIGRRALQLMSGNTIMVVFLSRSDSIERVAIIAGTLHPKPRISGTKDFPCSPKRLITPSMINAARAIYPLSSRSASAKNINSMFGKNTTTPPTPPIIPSVKRSLM